MHDLDSLPWQHDNPMSPILKQHIRLLFDLEKLGQEEKQARLQQQLTELLAYCKQSVDYYREHLHEYQADAFSLTDFHTLPILSKDLIRHNEEALVSNLFKQGNAASQIHSFHTSGSTGTPMKVYRGQRNVIFTRSLSLYYHILHKRQFERANVNIVTCKEHRLSPGKWVGGLNTGPGYQLRIDENSETLFQYLLDLKPGYIQTHPSTLKRLIDLSIEKGQALENLLEVRTFGELLEPGIKQACNKHWHVPVSDNYSSEEMASMAFSCPYGDHYHVFDENVYIEVVNEQGLPCQPGEIGRVLVTQLKNLAMPLLRYEIGDMAIKADATDCPFNMPALSRIEGRRRNLVRMPNGDTFHPVFDEEKILAVAKIKRYQLVQTSLEHIDIHILGAPLSSEQENALRQVFGESFKGLFNFSFHYHDDIPFSQRNKFELFKCEISD